MEPSESADPPPPPRCGSSFPLLFLLIPQILAWAFCENAPRAAEFSPESRLAAGTFFLALAAAAGAGMRFAAGTPERRRALLLAWRICVPVAAFFLFCAWHLLRATPLEDWTGKSPRDAETVLRVEKPSASPGKNFSGIARAEEISGEGLEALAGTRVWYSVPKKLCARTDAAGDGNAPAEGDRLRVRGVVSAIAPSGAFSAGFVEYLRRERVSAFLSRVEAAEKLDPQGDGAFPRWCASAKNFLRGRIAAISSRGNADAAGTSAGAASVAGTKNATGTENADAGTADGFLSRSGRILGAMLLGDRAALTPSQRENFLLTGTMHIFAVSGLHVSILAAGTLFLLRKIRVPRVPARLATLAALLLYVRIVGAPPAAMRAWMMAAFIFAGSLFGRGRMPFHGLIAAACVALLIEPSVAGNGGFRLSYFVVAAILLYGVPAADALSRRMNFGERWRPEAEIPFTRKIAERAARFVAAGACVSFAAFLAGTPSLIAMFGICPFASLAANIVLAPLVFVGACLGAAAVAASCLPLAGTLLGKMIFAVAEVPLSAVDFLAEIFSKIPATAELSFPHAEFGVVGGLLMLALFFFGERLRALRERAWLRFALPPAALGVFLLLFAHGGS